MKTNTSLVLCAVALFNTHMLVLNAAAAELRVPADYPTIQAAIDADPFPGDIIRITAGDYYEQLVIVDKTDLTLLGEPGTVLHATTGMTQKLLAYGFDGYAVVAVHRSDVVISSVTILGNSLGESYPTPLNGLDFFAASGVVTNCIVSGFRGVGTTTDPVRGRGVHCFNPLSTGAPPIDLTIINNTFTNNQVAVHLRGDPRANPELLRATAKVQANRIVGFGPAPDWNVGIWLVCGVAADVTDNTISAFAGTTTWDSAGVAAYDAAAQRHSRFVSLLPTKYEGNTFSNNGQHLLMLAADESQILNNKFVGTPQNTFFPYAVAVSGTNIVVANNNFADLPAAIVPPPESSNPALPKPPPAVSPIFSANWFCNVPEPIRTVGLGTGFQEQGTERCENGPLRPRLQATGEDDAAVSAISLAVRAWHDQPVIVESSTNLQQWIPVHTNAMTLPSFDFQAPTEPEMPRQFYRARQ